MRRLLAIVVAVLVGLPAVLPLFAFGGGVDLTRPACCRRDGKHHCMLVDMDAATAATSGRNATAWKDAAISERCPYGSRTVPVNLDGDWALSTAEAVYAGIVAHPAAVPQTESKRRISADRSRQKRGPPATANA